jgi:hypothetical protein
MRIRSTILLTLVVVLVCLPVWAQGISNADRTHTTEMLDKVAADVKKYSWDPALHGIDFDARVAEAKLYIERYAQSYGQAVGAIALALDGLQDSHTNFLPPQQFFKAEYGFRLNVIGEKCFITDINPGSDAEKNGLKPGESMSPVWTLPVFTGERMPQPINLPYTPSD